MHVDVKVTTWQRISLPDDADRKVVIKVLEQEHISSLWDHFEDVSFEALAETEHYLTPEENEGKATVELFLETGDDPFWVNT
ncbi:MAG TPA: hypothetical protein DCL77_01725 [Prolixibacteraceae bacterium]|jgi:hypothetical protein|nr:hypothetical protein [Prolixibacteraceae bacterium]